MGYFNGNKVGSVVRPPKSLVAKTLVLSNIGWHMAYDEGVEGFSAVYCEPPVLPSSVKDFIVGNNNIVTLFLEADISEVKGCFQCFPNLTTLIVSNPSLVVIFPSNMLDGTSINKIVVPQPLYNQYVTRYPQYADYGDSHVNLFDYWTASVDYTLPFVGETTLTAEYVQQVAAMLGEQTSIVTHLIIPNDFETYITDAFDTVLNKFPSLNDITSPWLNGSLGDVLEWKFRYVGTKTVTADLLSSEIETLGTIMSSVSKIHFDSNFNNFTLKSLEGLSNYPNVYALDIEGYVFIGDRTNGLSYKEVLGTAEPQITELTGKFSFYYQKRVALNYVKKLIIRYAKYDNPWWYPSPTSYRNFEEIIPYTEGDAIYGSYGFSRADGFSNNSKLKYIGKFNMAGFPYEGYPDCFNNCPNLVDIDAFGFNNTMNISNTGLQHDNLVKLLNNLGTVTNKTLTIGTTKLAMLTEQEKDIARNKGWTLA